MTTKTTSRRAVLSAAAALAAAPAIAGTTSGVGADTAIGRLWTQAEQLRAQLGAHRAAIVARDGDGIPGWMRLAGAPSDIGNRRHETLVSILKAEPRTGRDIALMAKAALEDDMLQKGWASEQVLRAAAALAGETLA